MLRDCGTDDSFQQGHQGQEVQPPRVTPSAAVIHRARSYILLVDQKRLHFCIIDSGPPGAVEFVEEATRQALLQSMRCFERCLWHIGTASEFQADDCLLARLGLDIRK
jgi:hypothetical protein